MASQTKPDLLSDARRTKIRMPFAGVFERISHSRYSVTVEPSTLSAAEYVASRVVSRKKRHVLMTITSANTL